MRAMGAENELWETHFAVGKEPLTVEDNRLVATAPTWQQAHQKLLTLAHSRAGLDFEEGRWLLWAQRGRAHARLGYASFVEYVERLFGYAPRLTHDKLRVAVALESLPLLERAFRAGEVSWCALRELTRVVTAQTEAEWLAATRGKTVREVERLVSGRAPGSKPTDEPSADLKRHVLRFEVSAEALATFREAVARLEREAGHHLDDDDMLLLLARQVLAGPDDPGRSPYQVVLSVCERCKRGTQHAQGERMDVPAPIVEMAACDAQQIRIVPGAPARASDEGETGGQTHVGHADADLPRATQTISPALRRAVLLRDSGCCVFPGCRHARFVDIHHIVARADGGAHQLENLVTLCSAHHRALHRGAVSVQGSPKMGLRFHHADHTPYGIVPASIAIDTHSRAFQALRNMGFREGEVRRALAFHPRVVSDVGQLMRSALLTLTAHVGANAH